MRLFAAALALTLGLAGCGPVDGDPIRSGASAPDNVPRQDAVTVAQLRQQAEQNGSLAVVLYLGSVPERTADVDAALDSLQEQPWQFVTDIPADHRVTAPGGGRELYCLFAVSSREEKLLHMLPEEFRTVYAPILRPDGETEQLVKAADKLSAYIKCVEELKAGNNEFREAAAQTRAALEGYGLPEVVYFLETFLPSFSLTLDELK